MHDTYIHDIVHNIIIFLEKRANRLLGRTRVNITVLQKNSLKKS